MRRRLQYWRVVDGNGAPLEAPDPWRITATLTNAKRRGVDRHFECKNGMTVLGHPVEHSAGPIIVLDRVRTGNYPSAGDGAGNRRPIPLGEDDVLLEPTYVLFLQGGYVAILAGGDGPHAQRLAEYIRGKFNCEWRIEPVLRDNLDEVLAEMRITELQISVPTSSITRELVGGDWFEALEAGKRLAEDGTVRIGMSVGRKGDQNFKERMSEMYRARVFQLRQSLGLQDFNSARVHGRRLGNPQMVDLIEDRLVHSVEVEADQWFDSDLSVEYASEVLVGEVSSGEYSEYLFPPLDLVRNALEFNPGRSNG